MAQVTTRAPYPTNPEDNNKEVLSSIISSKVWFKHFGGSRNMTNEDPKKIQESSDDSS